MPLDKLKQLITELDGKGHDVGELGKEAHKHWINCEEVGCSLCSFIQGVS